MTWILFVIITSYNSAAIESREFHGESRCHAAREQVILHMSDNDKEVEVFCVRK